jgi:hypothetical protein
VAARLLEQHPSARVVTLTGGLIAWYNAGAPMEDPDGNTSTELHPGFMEALQQYIHCTDEDVFEEEVATGAEGG